MGLILTELAATRPGPTETNVLACPGATTTGIGPPRPGATGTGPPRPGATGPGTTTPRPGPVAVCAPHADAVADDYQFSRLRLDYGHNQGG